MDEMLDEPQSNYRTDWNVHKVSLPKLLERERVRSRQLERELARTKAELTRAISQVVTARQRAMHDELTLLPNRTLFRDRVRSALADTDGGQGPLAVLYLDLDGFKLINDTHGHDVGDKLLTIVGTRLARAVRAEDTVSRLGGDEFGCLLTGLASREELRGRANKLVEAISTRLRIGDLVVSVQGSTGIAMAPRDGTTVDDLMKNADAAMYRAKRRKSRVAFFTQCEDLWHDHIRACNR